MDRYERRVVVTVAFVFACAIFSMWQWSDINLGNETGVALHSQSAHLQANAR